jgi:Protein of unknown function (DUF3307)
MMCNSWEVYGNMQPLSKLILAALLAHLLGDFPLQTSAVVQGKGRGSRAYLAHGAIHLIVLAICISIFIGPAWLDSLRFWVAAVVYVALHLGIDLAKHRLVTAKRLPDSTAVFLFDQALHVCAIFALAWFLARPGWADVRSDFRWSPMTGERILQAAVVYVAVVFAGGYLIRYLTRNLAASVRKAGETTEQIRNAGLYIGWLERFLVMTAILVQSPSMIGLILTGKSIARFPELKEHFAEYFLIGTLLSIALAVLGGLLLAKLWYGTILLK